MSLGAGRLVFSSFVLGKDGSCFALGVLGRRTLCERLSSFANLAATMDGHISPPYVSWGYAKRGCLETDPLWSEVYRPPRSVAWSRSQDGRRHMRSIRAQEQAQAALPEVVEAMRSIVKNYHAHDEHRIQAAALLVDIASTKEPKEEEDK